MNYILYGSLTSPYVRKLRMVLENLPYELRTLDVYSAQDGKAYNSVNPLNQVPALIHDGKTILDSRIIFSYLNDIHQFESRTIDDENILSIIDGAINAGIALFQCKRSGLNSDDMNVMFYQRHHDRISSALSHLSAYLQHQACNEWNYNSISLYCFLDWAFFRGVISQEKFPFTKAFMEAHSQRPIVIATQIPKS